MPLDAEPARIGGHWLRPQDSEAGSVERLFRIRVEAFDWNCPQFITPRFTAAEVEERERPLREHIAVLEHQLLQLQSSAPDPDPEG